MGQSIVPVLRLGTDDRLDVSFDDLMHNYRRFSYTIEHVGKDFISEEGLFESEYMETDDDRIVIEGYEQSFNTSILYNHYSFSLPNANIRPLISGNYRLTVFVEDDEGDEQKAFETYFAVSEQISGIQLSATTNTNFDFNNRHQQLTIEVDHSALKVRDAKEELSVVVVQNQKWGNAVRLFRPTSQSARSLKWEHSEELIFSAGNEYRKFEQMSLRYPGMHVENVRYYEPNYFTTLMVDIPRKNYLYDEDQNGLFVPRSDKGGDAHTEADYTWTLFSLDADLPHDTDIYVDGLWTYGNFNRSNRLQYNPESGRFEVLMLLKHGYYSYQYLVVEGDEAKTGPIEGDFYETENEYDVFVYFRSPSERYDRLVGWRTASYRKK